MNLILTHILAQVQFNRNVIHQCTKWKRNLSPFSSGYIQQQHPHQKNVKMPEKKSWKVQKVPLCSECCTAHTTGTVHSPLCTCWCLTIRPFI